MNLQHNPVSNLQEVSELPLSKDELRAAARKLLSLGLQRTSRPILVAYNGSGRDSDEFQNFFKRTFEILRNREFAFNDAPIVVISTTPELSLKVVCHLRNATRQGSIATTGSEPTYNAFLAINSPREVSALTTLSDGIITYSGIGAITATPILRSPGIIRKLGDPRTVSSPIACADLIEEISA